MAGQINHQWCTVHTLWKLLIKRRPQSPDMRVEGSSAHGLCPEDVVADPHLCLVAACA